MKRLALVVSIGLSIGCAPAVAPLVEQHHAREELCALGNVSADDERLIRAGLERDLDAKVAVEAIDLNDPDVHGVAIRVTTNALPIDRLEAYAKPVTDGIVSDNPYSLAALVTHEKIPDARTVGPSAVETGVIAFFFIATVGIVRIEPSRSRTEYPSEQERRRAAPRASALADRLESGCAKPATAGIALRCRFAFAVKNDAPKPAAIDLEITLRAQPERRDACVMTKHVRVDL